MMTTRLAIAMLAVLALGACAERQVATDHAIQQQCQLELEAARTAMQLRDSGKTKSALVQTLPPLTPSSTRLLKQMYHIVDEVYAYPDLNQIVYGTYRFEYCAHQLRHQPVLSLQNSIVQLQACQAQFGMTVSKQAVDCVRTVFTAPPAVTAPPDAATKSTTP